MAARSNSCVVVEVGEEYPYRSHVCAPNFITVKLSGREMYDLWETQMLCLLEAHGMLGFIQTTSPPTVKEGESSRVGKEKEKEAASAADYMMLWRRSDALVKGWILGSLCEHVLRHIINLLNTKRHHFTAKDVWDKLQTIYGPPAPPLLQQSDLEEKPAVIQSEDAESNNNYNEEEEKKRKAEGVHPLLYQATLSQDLYEVADILKTEQVKLTDKITINGNTALHVAVGTTKNTKFLEYMLNLAAKDNPRLDMKNSEGSTLLHVAAIVGNTEAANMLVERNRELLFAKDNDGVTPLGRALSNMHTDTYHNLLYTTDAGDRNELDTLFGGTRGDELLVNFISSNDYFSAYSLFKDNYRNLDSNSVLVAIAQNFPRHLKTWERSIVYKFICHLEDKVYTITDYVKKKMRTRELKNFSKCTCRTALGAVFFLIPCVFCGMYMLLLRIILILVRQAFMFVEEIVGLHDDATRLLRLVCRLGSHVSSSHHQYYTNPVLEATIHDAYEVVVIIVSFFPDAIWSTNEDGHNIIQLAVINRSVNVYNLLYQMSEHKNVYKTIKDPFGNNLLHLAARLAPTNKLNYISGAALQIQHELQWFKEVKRFVCPLNITQQNSFGETPQMVFTREHEELIIKGEKWMKATAESYTITAALIITIVFAAAITVPGGNNQDTGIPIFTNTTAFTIFAISDAISLFTSVTSLLMFLSILTARFAEQDFLFKLPTKLVIGLAALFISTTAMIVAFGATLFLVFSRGRSWILIPIAALTCLPIISFVTLQFPLIVDLVSSTYGRSIFGKKREDPFY